MIIEYCAFLDLIKKYSLPGQLLRAETSIAANPMEGQNASSKADFIHKLKQRLMSPKNHILAMAL